MSLTERIVTSAEISAVLSRREWSTYGFWPDRAASLAFGGPVSLSWDDSVEVDNDCGYELTPEGVAIIPIKGEVINSELTWWMSYLGYTSTPALVRTINAAVADGNVKGKILFDIECPGGQVAGWIAACNAVWNARQAGFTVWATCKMVASAAYELASQCDRIYITEDCMAGCIGTVIVTSDWSAYFNQQGIVRERITSTGAETYKGEGSFGTKLTPEIKADLKRHCDEFRDLFNGVILRGRGSLTEKKLKQLADGRVHIGRNALSLGLVDGIATSEDVLAALGSDDFDAFTGIVQPEPDDDDADSDEDNQPSDKRQTRHQAASGKPGAASLSPRPEQGRKDNPMVDFKAIGVRYANALQLKSIAVALSGSNATDAEAVITEAMDGIKTEVAAQVANNPMILACETHGVKTAADVLDIAARAKLGDEYLAELRAEAKSLAIQAYGAVDGEKHSSSVDHLPASSVKALKIGFQAALDEKIKREPGKPGARQTLPRGSAVAVESDEAQPTAAAIDTAEIYSKYNTVAASGKK